MKYYVQKGTNCSKRVFKEAKEIQKDSVFHYKKGGSALKQDMVFLDEELHMELTDTTSFLRIQDNGELHLFIINKDQVNTIN